MMMTKNSGPRDGSIRWSPPAACTGVNGKRKRGVTGIDRLLVFVLYCTFRFRIFWGGGRLLVMKHNVLYNRELYLPSST